MATFGYALTKNLPISISAGYVLEKSLSVDNLMVFMAIFALFGISAHLQHRILYWGIIGALVFRGIFVAIGNGLFLLTPWIGFAFAAFVLWSAFRRSWKESVLMMKRKLKIIQIIECTLDRKIISRLHKALWRTFLCKSIRIKQRAACECNSSRFEICNACISLLSGD